ncbi:MAG: hypothetical protein COT37_00915 [Parcubacteria group bacterium CG08_land_8_20_14_0_20_43_9]|nr:MAG: hypothetical protein COT37_00915 [Parcubacteria group bacterium CG08_land_8_20_14_0_20_43_9]
MKGKIYDIIPPRRQSRQMTPERAVLPKTEEKETAEMAETLDSIVGEKEIASRNPKKRRKRPGARILAFLIVLAIAAGVSWFFSSAKDITIELAPKTEDFSLEASLAITTSTSEFILPSDLSQTIIPVESIEIEKDFNKEFPAAQVLVEEKAKGIIRVYNKHTRNISLVENTRFLSSSEPTSQFHAETKIVAPMGGFVDIPVIASEAGEEYNIEPCVFSVPGLRNYSPPQLYYDVYGKSFSKMEGGRKETILKVTKEALENAQKELLASARKGIETFLQEEAGEGYRILGDSIEVELIDSGSLNAEEGQEIDRFVYRISVRAKALMAKTDYLLEFGSAYLANNIPNNKERVSQSIEVAFLAGAGGSLREFSAKVGVSSKVYSAIDAESIKAIVKGRSKKEIVRYSIGICPELKEQPKVIFNPFWARRASLGADQVKISVILE